MTPLHVRKTQVHVWKIPRSAGYERSIRRYRLSTTFAHQRSKQPDLRLFGAATQTRYRATNAGQ
jgi:hypothetical protein